MEKHPQKVNSYENMDPKSIYPILKSERDPNSYRYIRLPNGLEALLIEDKIWNRTSDLDQKGNSEEKYLAGAAITVGAGTLYDPIEA
jgi:secreted Zn-dependent insulinase-like peptidase